jgi:dCMP deaminase
MARAKDAAVVEAKIPLGWIGRTDPKVLNKMYQYKLDRSYVRPTHLDIIAQQAVVISKRSTCLFYEVGAVIFKEQHGIILSTGYNGASKGDVDPRHEGCARIVDGVLKEGGGLCRGSHAELNAINNLSAGTFAVDDLSMMITLHPCYGCAKQIVNKDIKRVYYIWEYGREDHVTGYLERLNVEVICYKSAFLQRWIDRNGYDPIGLRHHEP